MTIERMAYAEGSQKKEPLMRKTPPYALFAISEIVVLPIALIGYFRLVTRLEEDHRLTRKRHKPIGKVSADRKPFGRLAGTAEVYGMIETGD